MSNFCAGTKDFSVAVKMGGTCERFGFFWTWKGFDGSRATVIVDSSKKAK